jgi:hypothetical protein
VVSFASSACKTPGISCKACSGEEQPRNGKHFPLAENAISGGSCDEQALLAKQSAQVARLVRKKSAPEVLSLSPFAEKAITEGWRDDVAKFNF